MKRARFEGTAPFLWIAAALLATLFYLLDPNPLGQERAPERRPPPRGDTRFFELPPLPPHGSDAGIP